MSSTVAARPAPFAAETRAARRAMRTRSRAVAWGEIIALVLITAALIAATVLSAGRANATVASERVRIESGQTLWLLASEHPVAGLTTEQTAEVMTRLNGLHGGKLVAGTSIRMPVEADSALLVACR